MRKRWGNDRFGIVFVPSVQKRKRQENDRFPIVFRFPVTPFQAGTVTRAAAPSLLLSLILEVDLYFVVVSFLSSRPPTCVCPIENAR